MHSQAEPGNEAVGEWDENPVWERCPRVKLKNNGKRDLD